MRNGKNMLHVIMGALLVVAACSAQAGNDSDWTLAGNAGTTPAANFVGTTDNQALVFKVNAIQALRLEPMQNSPNVIGGCASNVSGAAVYGAAISGGGYANWINQVLGHYGVVGGGAGNTAGNLEATVAGGYRNSAGGIRSTVAGGLINAASGTLSTVGGGSYNVAQGNYSTVAGGSYNLAQGEYSIVAGGGPRSPGFNPAATRNRALGSYCTVSGGANNRAGDSVAPTSYGTVAGGQDNIASGAHAAVGGGLINQASGSAATVAGGQYNEATDDYATVGGGESNIATALDSTVAGGITNSAIGDYATVGGGYNNNAIGPQSTVSGGYGNVVSGIAATVPGGSANEAAGTYSFAAGRRAKSNFIGAFTWADSTDSDLNNNASNRFMARASGGFYFYTNADANTGARLSAGSGAWTDLSSRESKQDMVPVNPCDVLDKVACIPVTTWKYKAEQGGVRHMGPMAQDVYAAFGLGDSDTGICTVDASGIALAAIQGLAQRLEEKDARITALESEIKSLRQLIRQSGR